MNYHNIKYQQINIIVLKPKLIEETVDDASDRSIEMLTNEWKTLHRLQHLISNTELHTKNFVLFHVHTLKHIYCSLDIVLMREHEFLADWRWYGAVAFQYNMQIQIWSSHLVICI